MRNPSKSSNISDFPARPQVERTASYPRRTLAPIPGNLTCLVLIRHMASQKAVKVSDNGDQSKAVWCPRSMLMLDPADRGIFLVATLPKFVAEKNNLHPRFIDAEKLGLTIQQAVQLAEAESLAARKRNQLRKYRDPLPFPGRNAFA